MDLEPSSFSVLNVLPDFKLPECLDYFTLTAPSNTAIWRKPFSPDEATAPMLLTRLLHPFIVAEVTISANFEMEWDQGGLIVFAGAPPGETPPPSAVRRRRRSRGHEDGVECGKWVRAGLEFTGGSLNASSVVATSQCGADWSLSPLLPPGVAHETLPPNLLCLRIKFERIGDSLWIWYRSPGASSILTPRSPEMVSTEWRKLREVMGFFCGVEAKEGVWVGCYASRPINYTSSNTWDRLQGDLENTTGLLVEFEDLEIL